MTRIIFMGTPSFAIPPLKKLIEAHQSNRYTLVGIYTQPPRPKNRGHHVTKSPVHELAESYNLPVFTPTSLKKQEEQDIFKNLNADIAIVVAYGLILPLPILEAPRLGCLNIHGSLLPRWRGAAPIHRAMLEGDHETGITLMSMDEGLDTGDMLSMQSYPLHVHDSFQKVHDDLSEMGADLLMRTLPDFLDGKIIPQKQPIDGVTYAHKLHKDEGLIHWSHTSERILRHINTLNPWPGTYTSYKGQMLKIKEASLCTLEDQSEPATPGKILPHGHVICGDGKILSLDKLQREGGKILSKEDFLRGFNLQAGEVLTSLTEKENI